MHEDKYNWAGNYRFEAERIAYPRTITEASAFVAGSSKVRALGTRHSFNGIADTEGTLLSLRDLDYDLRIAPDGSSVSASSAVPYGILAQYLQTHGYALHNLGSLPHISIGGACATGTHGSGDGNGNLATAVTAMEMICADGALRRFSAVEHGEKFHGMVLALGALGIVSRLELRIEPTYEIQQNRYSSISWSVLLENFDEIMSGAYSVNIFTRWSTDSINRVVLKSRLRDGVPRHLPDEYFGGTRALAPTDALAENHTLDDGVAGPWNDQLPHFKMGLAPSHGEEIQSEYFVARTDVVPALKALRELGKAIDPLLIGSEIRSIAADELWLSPAYQEDVIGIHFTWRKIPTDVQLLLPRIEEALSPFRARPHWGKAHTMDYSVIAPLFRRIADFHELIHELDPEGKFSNDYLRRNVTDTAADHNLKAGK